MLNENPNDLNWKNKLEDVDSLHGETLQDKGAAWEKLHTRLSRQPRRKRYVWYWAAAGGLLAVLITSVLTTGKKEVAVNENNLPPITHQKQAAWLIVPSKDIAVQTAAVDTTEKREIRNVHVKTNIRKLHSIQLSSTSGTVSGILNDQKNIEPEQIVLQPPALVTVTPTAMARATPRTKLRVVHINEISGMEVDTRNLAHTENYRSFKVRLINPDVISNSSSASGITGFNIFKTINTP